MSLIERTRSRARYLWEAAKRERASPRQIGVAVGVGTMACLAPLLWFHLPSALLLATIFRLNRLWAAAASQLPSLFGLLRPFILFVQLNVGHLVLTGTWLDLNPREALRDAPHLLVAWGVGAGVTCAFFGVAFGLGAFAWAKRRDARAATTPRTPDESPRPSSESPP